MRSLTDLSCSAASREASINMRSVTLSGMRSVFFKSLVTSNSCWINAYDALLLAALEHGAVTIAIGKSAVERRAWACFQTVDVAQAVAANEAVLTVAAGGVEGKHSDGLDASVSGAGTAVFRATARLQIKPDAGVSALAQQLPC